MRRHGKNRRGKDYVKRNYETKSILVGTCDERNWNYNCSFIRISGRNKEGSEKNIEVDEYK